MPGAWEVPWKLEPWPCRISPLKDLQELAPARDWWNWKSVRPPELPMGRLKRRFLLQGCPQLERCYCQPLLAPWLALLPA